MAGLSLSKTFDYFSNEKKLKLTGNNNWSIDPIAINVTINGSTIIELIHDARSIEGKALRDISRHSKNIFANILFKHSSRLVTRPFSRILTMKQGFIRVKGSFEQFPSLPYPVEDRER